MRAVTTHITMLAACVTLAPAAKAAGPDDWSVVVSPYAWLASLDGKAGLAGFRTEVDVPFSEALDHLDLAVFGEVEVRSGRWGLLFDGQHIKTSQDEELLSQTLDLGITKSHAQGAVFYRIYDSPQGGDTVTGAPRRFTVDPMIGLRWNRLKADVEILGLSGSRRAEWTEPFVGVKSSWDVSPRWNLAGEADVGGFGVDSKTSANAQASLGYRTMLLQRPTLLRAGYRVFHQEYKTGDFTGQVFHWDVTQHGPVVGLSVAF